jgi:ribosomal protein S18 acetylase RimI-like enzyme
MRGYIAMLATREQYRGRGIASRLVRMTVEKMIEKDADEVERNHSEHETHFELTGHTDRSRDRSR